MTSESTIKVRRVELPTDHENQKWLVLEGYIDGIPQLTKRRTIDTASLASGRLTIADEKAKLIADVVEYRARWGAVQQAVSEL